MARCNSWEWAGDDPLQLMPDIDPFAVTWKMQEAVPAPTFALLGTCARTAAASFSA